MSLALVLLLIAVVIFVIAAIGWGKQYNLVAAGLAFFAGSFLFGAIHLG
jgi:hypothetical protein